MDKLLGAFTKRYIDELNNEDLADLEKLLDIDDTNLYNFFNGLETDYKFLNNKINLMFKNFNYSDCK
ncbi:succinate dehydrogenase assembly factor 2 [Candidatus Pelagibacter bacterium nBUS_32]|uniref:succinate dehydrogenase assembly factor 2 n=1 Tax=Candidatus Pelagibacter bacterium nBUS_32 TaxID=3374192 RepID=UPI003EBC4B9F